MSKNVKVTNQRVSRIALSVIKSGGYQRPTNPRQVDKIVNGFSEAKLGMPVVSHRDGQFYIIDGNHRVSALRKLNFTHAHFIVLDGLTYEGEAEFFRTQGEGSRNLTKFNLYGAALEAKDPLTVSINNAVEANGFRIGMSRNTFDVISAIHAVETVATIYDIGVLGDTLSLIRKTWNGQKQATYREFIVGIAEFVNRFGTADFAKRMRFKDIGEIWQDYLRLAPKNNRQSANPLMRKAFCTALVDHYNKGLSWNSKIRLKMED